MRVNLRHPWLLCWLLAAALALLASCTSKVRPLQDPSASEPQPVEVLVVPLHDAMTVQEVALGLRALREAKDQLKGGMRVVFRFDHMIGSSAADGDVAALLDAVQASDVGTYALVRGDVMGGAAALALACDQLHFLGKGSVGSVTPIESTWEAIQAELDKEAERRRFQSLGAEMKARMLARKDHDKLRADAIRLCEGMADYTLKLSSVRLREGGVESERIVDQSELAGLQAAGATILAQDDGGIGQPVQLDARRCEDFGLGVVVQSLDDYWRDVLRVERARVGELEFSWSERMVGWLAWMQPALLVLGFVLLLLEVKTPGVGLPGVLGAMLLALALFYGWLVGLAEISEILLFVLGLAAIAVEIFVLPGTIVFGATGFLCLVFALVLSRQTFVLPHNGTQEDILLANLWQLTFLFVLVLVLAGLLWRYLPRIPWLNTVLLSAPQPALATVAPDAARGSSPLLGRRGRTATVLRPSGIVELDGDPVDVVTRGEFVERGVEVQVVEVEGNRVVVEPIAPVPEGRAGARGRSDSGNVGFVLLIAVAGLALLVAEVAIVSFGALAVASGVLLITAVFMAFQESNAFGIAMLIGEAIAAPLVLTSAFRVLPRTKLGRAMLLEAPTPEAVRPQVDPRVKALLHKTGVAVSPLRPAGFARIDGVRIDVVTRGEMLDEGQSVRVVEVGANRVVVARHEPSAS